MYSIQDDSMLRVPGSDWTIDELTFSNEIFLKGNDTTHLFHEGAVRFTHALLPFGLR